jgi:hypothetical protein|tara:strand:+ start:8694 stop:8900 length:207 start_codon:yes stop_codon:yes gene_type:complete
MSSVVSLTNHLLHLEEIHRALDEKITRHYERRDSDDSVTKEKLEKLALKKEIQDLKKQIEGMADERSA